MTDMKDFNVNNTIGKWARDPAKYLYEGWYELGGRRGRWFFRRLDPVIVTDPYGLNPTFCHVNFLTRTGVIMCENRFNGFAYPAVPPDANRVWPVDLFHPLGARYNDAA